jgi:hypothetical protein
MSLHKFSLPYNTPQIGGKSEKSEKDFLFPLLIFAENKVELA